MRWKLRSGTPRIKIASFLAVQEIFAKDIMSPQLNVNRDFVNAISKISMKILTDSSHLHIYLILNVQVMKMIQLHQIARFCLDGETCR